MAAEKSFLSQAIMRIIEKEYSRCAALRCPRSGVENLSGRSRGYEVASGHKMMMMMASGLSTGCRRAAESTSAWFFLVLAIWFCGGCCYVQGQTPPVSFPPGFTTPPAPPGVGAFPPGTSQSVISAYIYNRIQDMTQNMTASIQTQFSFCITNG